MAQRKFKETKLQLGTAGPGNILGCCLIFFLFLWGKLCPQAVHGPFYTFIIMVVIRLERHGSFGSLDAFGKAKKLHSMTTELYVLALIALIAITKPRSLTFKQIFW